MCSSLRITTQCALLCALALASVACSKARPLDDVVRTCTSWREEVKPVADVRCAGCHSGATPAGDYDLTSYLGALGDGSDDEPNVKAGDPTSQILSFLDPATADSTHAAFADDLPVFRAWVVGCEASRFRSFVHPGGILDVHSSDFHGTWLRSMAYDFDFCRRCHGDNLDGGKAGVACTSCHTEEGGPRACNTCHGSADNPAPPDGVDHVSDTSAVNVGAHQTHVTGGALGKTFDCSECHTVPASPEVAGHYLSSPGVLDPSPAEVTLGAFASTTLDLADRAGAPTWDRDTATCSNVYCHGDALGGRSNAGNTQPTWTSVGSGEADCGSCHGLPPEGHTSDQCYECHDQVVDSDRNFIDPSLHIDGQIEVNCRGCHGDATSPAPPRDLMGNTSRRSVGVGAHRAHLDGSRLRGPMDCTQCHIKPATVADPGHRDTDPPAEVFPDDARFSSLASSDGAMPSYDHATATCTDVYCHGNGDRFSRDTTSPGRTLDPVWTSVGSVFCGTCHAIPPNDGIHDPMLAITRCVGCHRPTIDIRGRIVFTGEPGSETTTHINGMVDR